MNSVLRNRFAKIVIWVAAEILLNFLGVDDLADFGEYVFERQYSINKITKLGPLGGAVAFNH